VVRDAGRWAGHTSAGVEFRSSPSLTAGQPRGLAHPPAARVLAPPVDPPTCASARIPRDRGPPYASGFPWRSAGAREAAARPPGPFRWRALSGAAARTARGFIFKGG
jgi:hypothetical protein